MPVPALPKDYLILRVTWLCGLASLLGWFWLPAFCMYLPEGGAPTYITEWSFRGHDAPICIFGLEAQAASGRCSDDGSTTTGEGQRGATTTGQAGAATVGQAPEGCTAATFMSGSYAVCDQEITYEEAQTPLNWVDLFCSSARPIVCESY